MPDVNGKPLAGETATVSTPLLTNKLYDRFKAFVLFILPGIITLVGGTGAVLEWSATDKVVAILALVNTFLGGLVKVLQVRYDALPTAYDGELIANDPNPDADTFRLDFNNTLTGLAAKDEIRLKVVDLLPKDSSQ